MLMAVFEKLWPDMENPNATAIHKIHKGVDGGMPGDRSVT